MVTIVFTAKDSWISGLIRWITRGKTSHVFLEYTSDLWGGRWAAESGSHGVRKIPASMARRNTHIVAEFGCKFPTEAAIKKVAALIGERYDFGGLAVFAWAILTWRMCRKKFKKPMNNTRGQFCSEFVTRFLQAAGKYPADRDPEFTSPQDLLDCCLDLTKDSSMVLLNSKDQAV
jgi:hypothetical protein